MGKSESQERTHYIAFPMGNFSFDCLLDRAVTRGNGLLGWQWRPFYCARTLEEPLGVSCVVSCPGSINDARRH